MKLSLAKHTPDMKTLMVNSFFLQNKIYFSKERGPSQEGVWVIFLHGNERGRIAK